MHTNIVTAVCPESGAEIRLFVDTNELVPLMTEFLIENEFMVNITVGMPFDRSFDEQCVVDFLQNGFDLYKKSKFH